MHTRLSGYSQLSISLIISCVALLAVVYPAIADDREWVAEARSFAERFMAGASEELEPLCTEAMKTALTPKAADGIRATLTAQNGTLQKIGDAWFEDQVQTYTRYRVPLFFAAATLDMRVVFDDGGRIAGMFFVAHSEQPVEVETTAREIDVLIGDAGTGIPGVLMLPAGDGPFPAAVFVHGSGPNDRDETIGPNKPFRELAVGLANRGIATLRYDKRSFARPGDLTAVGEDLTVQHEVIDDALLALALLRSRSEVQPDRVFVIGHSLGGTLAPRIAESDPRPNGIVILAGATLPLPDKIVEQTRYIVSLDGVVTAEEKEQVAAVEEAVATIHDGLSGAPIPAGNYLGAPLAYYRDLEGFDAPSQLGALGLPSLIIQGGRDYQVTLDDFERWQDALSATDSACLRVFDDLDHLLRAGSGPSGPSDYDVYEPFSAEVIDCIANWIQGWTCCDD